MFEKKSKEPKEAQQIHLKVGDCEEDLTKVAANQEVESNLQNTSETLISAEWNKEHVEKSSIVAQQPIAPKIPETDDSQEQVNMQPKFMLLLRRLVALIVDELICLSFGAFLIVPPLFFTVYLLFEAPFEIPMQLATAAIIGVLLCTCTFAMVSAFTYCAKFESSRWQATPGKLLMGLRVVDVQNERIKYGGIIWRLVIQGFIIWLLATCLASLSVSCLFAMHLTPNNLFKVALPIISIAACYVFSLFTSRSQTLFDMATRRIVESGKWSISNQLTHNRLLEAIDIFFKGWRERRDWILILCTTWAMIMLIPSIGILLLATHALIETDQAINDSAKFKDIQTNPNYLDANRWFKNVDFLYNLASSYHHLIGDQISSTTDLRKATIISPNNWVNHCAYGLRLETQGEVSAAESELSQALSLRMSEKPHAGPWKNRIGGVSFSAGLEDDRALPLGEHYLKLGKLSNRLGNYKQAISYLDKAIKIDNEDPEKYLARSNAYRAVGNIKQAELDKQKSDNMLRFDMGNLEMQLHRANKSASVEWSSKRDRP